ncbi:MAG: peptide chain release factor N(5)-glutamine methyltransferase [Kiritimatiellae bacterium]|nr:peptide chain release factor N(5)-glutamine methyltransferase [Kiritimatiellia bacterium]
MTWRETIAKTEAFLEGRGVPDSRVAAESLAARLLKTGRGFLAGKADAEPSERELEAMRRGMKRLSAGEPLQYVIGEWDFRKLTLKCDRRALIPRPETEELVTLVIEDMKRRSNPFVVDVGTGTGAIILSIAMESAGGIFLGTDISADAIALAGENAARCGLSGRVRFAVADGLDEFDEPGMFDIIVSNPPYVESAVCKTLDPRIRNWEPAVALDGGADGLDFYDRYLTDALNLLKPGGSVFFEIGENQGAALEKMMRNCGFSDIRIGKDFSGRDRYASATLET